VRVADEAARTMATQGEKAEQRTGRVA